jgi:hypothetical protein
MDWPAEVVAGQPFRTRIVVWGLCAVRPVFHAGPQVAVSAVTFEPFFTFDSPAYCAFDQASTSLVAFALDTAGIAPGLGLLATGSRQYRMQALADKPSRVFGEVTVQASSPDESRRNAAGWIFSQLDSLGCRRISPLGLYSPESQLVLENPTDTANLSGRFVQGYIYQAAAPVCGESTVFHVVSRE